jgi:hypothetical protein
MRRALVGLVAATLALLAGRGYAELSKASASPSLELGVFFRHLRGSLLNDGAPGAWDPSQQDYRRLDEWSPNAWAPKRFDLALTVSGKIEEAIQSIERVRIAMAFKVGALRADPQVGLTDKVHLMKSSRWWPAEFVKVVSKADLVRRGDNLVVVQDVDFQRMYEDLWRSGLWPVELEVRALVDWKEDSRERHLALETHLRINPGD